MESECHLARETKSGGMHHESERASGELQCGPVQFITSPIATTNGAGTDGEQVASWQTNNGRPYHRSDSPESNVDTSATRETCRAVTRDIGYGKAIESGSVKQIRDEDDIFVSQKMILYTCLVFLLCNFVILGMQKKTIHSKDGYFVLPNGDHARPCSDLPGDDRCVEMTDAYGRIIYKSDHHERKLAFSDCSATAPETKHMKCLGEFAFSYNQTVMWYHRLYHDTDENSFSIISGPEAVGYSQSVPRIRHMLEEPYNWIISYDPIPKNSHRTTKLYVDGEILVQQYSDT